MINCVALSLTKKIKDAVDALTSKGRSINRSVYRCHNDRRVEVATDGGGAGGGGENDAVAVAGCSGAAGADGDVDDDLNLR